MNKEVGHCVRCCEKMNDSGHDLCHPNRPDVIHETEKRCKNLIGLEDHKSEYNPDDYRTIAFASIGHNSRASNLKMNKEQTMEMDFIMAALKRLLDEMYPTWETLNLELKEKVE